MIFPIQYLFFTNDHPFTSHTTTLPFSERRRSKPQIFCLKAFTTKQAISFSCILRTRDHWIRIICFHTGLYIRVPWERFSGIDRFMHAITMGLRRTGKRISLPSDVLWTLPSTTGDFLASAWA